MAASEKLLARGLNLHRVGRIGEARVCYEAILKSSPRNSDALHLLGMAWAADGEIERGIRFIQQALQLSPRFATGWFNLGNLLQKQRKSLGAVGAYKRAIAARSDFVDAYVNLGGALVSLGQLEEAESVFATVLAARPHAPDIHRNIGHVRLKRENIPAAVAAFEKAVELKPDSGPALADLGLAYFRQERFEEALQTFGRSLRFNPADATSWRALGDTLRALGNQSDASAAYSKAIALDPDFIPTLHHFARTAFLNGQVPEAIAALRQAAGLLPPPKNRDRVRGTALVLKQRTFVVPVPGAPVKIEYFVILSHRPHVVTVCAPTFFSLGKGPTEDEAVAAIERGVCSALAMSPQVAFASRAGPDGPTIDAARRHRFVESPDLLYLFAHYLEASDHLDEALEYLRMVRGLGFKNLDAVFMHARLEASLGNIERGAELHTEALQACLAVRKNPGHLGTQFLPDYFSRSDGLHTAENSDHSERNNVGPAGLESSRATNHAGLLAIEAHNLLAEDVINYYCDFSTARTIYRRRDQLRSAWVQARPECSVDHLVIGRDWVRNIGHIAYIGQLVKLRELGLSPWRKITVVADEKYVANRVYLDYWREHVEIVTSPETVRRLEPLTTSCGFRFSTLYPFRSRDPLYTSEIAAEVEAQWAERGPLLKLRPQHDEEGARRLASAGIGPTDWFVCLHVREAGYHRVIDQNHRNADLANYLPSIAAITARGGWVVRLGDPTMSPIAPSPRVFDYARSTLKSAEMDIYLTAKCRFFIGVNSGLSHVPYSFGTPMVITNWAVTGALPPYPANGLFLPKMLHSAATGRLVKFRDLFAPAWRDRTYRLKALDDDDVRLVENSADEILDIVQEMLDRLEGRRECNADDVELHRRFVESLQIEPAAGIARIGRNFLRQHRDLL